jgi:hypothetical protein
MATQHLRLPVRPHGEWRMPAPDGVLPKMRERFGGLQKTASKVGHFSSPLDLRVAFHPSSKQIFGLRSGTQRTLHSCFPE